MKKAVISYNFGNYDKAEPIQWKSKDWEYILFTDKETENIPKGWRSVILPEKYFKSDDPKRRANQVKFSPFRTCKEELEEEYDIVVVIDANMVVVGDMDAFVDIFCMSTMDGVFLNHPSIIGAYEDLNLCAELEKDDVKPLMQTYKYFESEGYPSKVEKYFQTGVSIRRNTSAWSIIEYFFYDHYKDYSKRDQPMMNFLHWKYDVLDLNIVEIGHISEFLNYETHHFEK
tara:strand:- start:1314 stop:2000 length:687 start_codon:yes stop_codon:yes gene_type:complete